MGKLKKAKQLDKLFITALNNNIFPGAAFAFAKREGEAYRRYCKSYGYAQLEPEKKELKANFYFDLASLSKPLATVPVLLALLEENKISADTTLQEIYPLCPGDKSEITIAQLMSHSSGFVSHREFFHELILLPETEKKEFLLKKIFAETLMTVPGKVHCYSDIGFMLLGLIIEKLTGQGLAELAKALIYRPAGLENELFFPALSSPARFVYVSTEKCLWSRKMLTGQVHDDNCRAMGGVAGHAGLFGTLHGVLTLCEQILDQWQGRAEHPAYSNALLQRILEPVGNSGWTMGFDMVSEQGSSSGNNFSGRSVGHLGFTGTSFWIDPEKECIAILLTNRVHPSRDNWKIKEFRPVFHDLLMEGE